MSVITLTAVRLSVVMLNALAPFNFLRPSFINVSDVHILAVRQWLLSPKYYKNTLAYCELNLSWVCWTKCDQRPVR
jgi:hypothetical protein